MAVINEIVSALGTIYRPKKNQQQKKLKSRQEESTGRRLRQRVYETSEH